MPTCSSSVARARRSLREGAMTTQALDANAILNVAGRVVRQPTHDGTATRPEALAVLLARQRAAFLRDGPPSLAERRANLKKLRAAVLARQGGSGSGARCRLRAPLAARNRDHGNPRTHVGDRLPAQEPAALHAARAPARGASHASRPRARRVSAARRRRHRGSVELPVLARADAARDRPRRGQSRDDQAVGAHAGDERCSWWR